MLYFVVERALSGIIIAAVSEIPKKRSPAFGGLAVSLPLVSLLGILQLRRDTRDAEGRYRLLAQPHLKLRGRGRPLLHHRLGARPVRHRSLKVPPRLSALS